MRVRVRGWCNWAHAARPVARVGCCRKPGSTLRRPHGSAFRTGEAERGNRQAEAPATTWVVNGVRSKPINGPEPRLLGQPLPVNPQPVKKSPPSAPEGQKPSPTVSAAGGPFGVNANIISAKAVTSEGCWRDQSQTDSPRNPRLSRATMHNTQTHTLPVPSTNGHSHARSSRRNHKLRPTRARP